MLMYTFIYAEHCILKIPVHTHTRVRMYIYVYMYYSISKPLDASLMTEILWQIWN